MLLGGRHPDQRRLSRAVGPDDDPPFIQLNFPVHGPYQHVAAAAEIHSAEVDEQVWIRLGFLWSILGSLISHAPYCGVFSCPVV